MGSLGLWGEHWCLHIRHASALGCPVLGNPRLHVVTCAFYSGSDQALGGHWFNLLRDNGLWVWLWWWGDGTLVHAIRYIISTGVSLVHPTRCKSALGGRACSSVANFDLGQRPCSSQAKFCLGQVRLRPIFFFQVFRRVQAQTQKKWRAQRVEARNFALF